jgi:hypothetical protein
MYVGTTKINYKFLQKNNNEKLLNNMTEINIVENDNYIQFVDVEHYNMYTGEVNKFNTITYKGITYIPLKSKKEEGKDCFWNEETGGILVWFSSKKDWYPYRSIERICEVTIMNEFGPKNSFDGGNIENFQIDIDAYMRGEVDIEFDNSDQEGGRTHIAFYIQKWLLNNSPDKTLTKYEIDEVIAEQNRKNRSHTPYAERGGGVGRDTTGWPMIVEWE